MDKGDTEAIGRKMLQIRQGYLKNIFKEYQNIVLFGAGTLTTAMFEAYKELGFRKKGKFYFR